MFYPKVTHKWGFGQVIESWGLFGVVLGGAAWSEEVSGERRLVCNLCAGSPLPPGKQAVEWKQEPKETFSLKMVSVGYGAP